MLIEGIAEVKRFNGGVIYVFNRFYHAQ